MKKIIIVLLCLILLFGCDNKKTSFEEETNNNNFVLEKADIEKDFVFLSDYKKLFYNDKEYNLQYLTINIVSDDIENINLELKSFVVKTYKDMEFNNDQLKKGNIVSYDWYINDDYISIIQRFYPYINGIKGEEEDNVYVVSLKTGKIMSNIDLLESFDVSENEIYDFIDKNSDLEDVEFTKMNIKNNGYKLYVNENNKLNIIYYEIDDSESIRKELVIN